MAGNRKVQLVLELGIAGTHYVPTFEITGGTRANIEKIELQRWAFERLIIDPRYEGWLRRRAFIRSGHHTLHLEGNPLTADEVANILDSPEPEVPEGAQKEQVRNWNRAMQFVDSISTSTVIPVTSLLIRHLHQLMLGPHERVHTPGEFRRGEARVRHPVSREVVYIGPDAGDVPDHMRQFETWLSSAAQDLSAVIAAGIAHLRLVEIHPFADGNGRTARALTTLLLQRGGFSFNRLLSLERYFDFDVVKYCDAIGATVGDRYADGRNLTEWLEYFTFALSVQVQVASDEVLALRKQMERWHTVLMEKGYVERHRDLLGFALTNGGIRPRDVMRIANVSSVTAGSDLKRLAEAGLLRGEGYGRARIFRVSEEFWQRL